MPLTPYLNPKLFDLARRDDTLLVFPHTQRTGGKTFRDQVMGAALGPANIYSAVLGTGSKNWRDVTAAELRPFRVFTGPSNYAALDKGRPSAFLGVVRHPLYRAVSLYFYVRGRESHKLHEIGRRCTLEEFYPEASRAHPVYFRNTQCLRLAGVADAKIARDTIETKYVGVGFTADLEGFSHALGAVLGWPPVSLKSAPADEDRYDKLLTANLREQILHESAEDLKLYLWLATGEWPASASLFARLGSMFRRSG